MSKLTGDARDEIIYFHIRPLLDICSQVRVTRNIYREKGFNSEPVKDYEG